MQIHTFAQFEFLSKIELIFLRILIISDYMSHKSLMDQIIQNTCKLFISFKKYIFLWLISYMHLYAFVIKDL